MSTVDRCNTCILPSDYPEIEFDEKGECNYCKQWKTKWADVNFDVKQQQLDRLLDRFKGKTRPYDCVVGLSGGKDSCYVAYILKQKGMNPLAVTFDNGFMSDMARDNIRKLVDILDLGHVTLSYSRAQMTRIYRNFLTHAGEFCSVCNVGIRVSLYRMARHYGAHLIVSGRSGRTEANSPLSFFSCSPGYFSNVAQTFLSRKEISAFLYFRQFKRIWWHILKRPLYMELPAFMPWNEDTIFKELEKHLDWQGTFGEQHQDCRMNNAKELLKLKKFNVTELTAKLSSLIRDGQMTREAALEKMHHHTGNLLDMEAETRGIMSAEFNLTDAEVDLALKLSHTKYLSSFDMLFTKLRSFVNRF